MLPAITEGPQDLDDDVRAVAAASLIPVVEGLVQLLPNKVCVSLPPAILSLPAVMVLRFTGVEPPPPETPECCS